MKYADQQVTNAIYEELKQEMAQMKRRIAALERAFDFVLMKDDLEAEDEAHQDLRPGVTISLLPRLRRTILEV
ncbi:MAG: hypothetical protein ACRECH_04350 [Nitrososphaerales archaeon]